MPAYIDDLLQDCSSPVAKALELLHLRTKPSIFSYKTPAYSKIIVKFCMM